MLSRAKKLSALEIFTINILVRGMIYISCILHRFSSYFSLISTAVFEEELSFSLLGQSNSKNTTRFGEFSQFHRVLQIWGWNRNPQWLYSLTGSDASWTTGNANGSSMACCLACVKPSVFSMCFLLSTYNTRR